MIELERDEKGKFVVGHKANLGIKHCPVPLHKEELEEMYLKEKLSIRQIAIKTGVDWGKIKRWMNRYGIPKRKKNPRNIQRIEEIRRLYLDEKLSQHQIAKRLGICHGAVSGYMKRWGIPVREQSEANRLAALPHRKFHSKAELEELYWIEGLSTIKIGEMVGISSTAVRRYLKRFGIPVRSLSQTRRGIKFPKTNTQPEKKFEEICRKHRFPFKRVSDGSFWIEKVNPDFVHVGDKKIAVDIFGDYWHKRPNLPPSETESGRRKILSKYGWEYVVFWESEIMAMGEKLVIEKLKEFLEAHKE